MITLRASDERGHAQHGWLDSYHTFSFANYYDPAQMGYRSLRVINEDRVEPGRGFGTHPHRDMEIITYVLEGALEHKDSLGNGSVMRPGDVQRMSAGTGVAHSEYNHSQAEPVHLLQIWILPNKQSVEPSYEQHEFSVEQKQGKLLPIVTTDGSNGSLKVHQDMRLYATILAPDEKVSHPLQPGRGAWVQVARGEVTVNGKHLQAGDGAALSDEATVEIAGIRDAEVLLFDLA